MNVDDENLAGTAYHWQRFGPSKRLESHAGARSRNTTTLTRPETRQMGQLTPDTLCTAVVCIFTERSTIFNCHPSM